MRALILIVHIFLAYILLKGWPEGWPIWMRAGIALIVIMVAIPMSETHKGAKKFPLLRSFRKPHWLDYLYIGILALCIEALIMFVFVKGPETAEHLTEKVHGYFTSSGPDTSSTDASKNKGKNTPPKKLNHGGDGNWLWDQNFQRKHPTRINNVPRNRPEVYLEFEKGTDMNAVKKTRLFLRSFSLNQFDGDTWSIFQPHNKTITASGNSNISFTSALNPKLPTYTYKVTRSYFPNGQNTLVALQNPITVSIEKLTQLSRDTYKLPPSTLEDGYNYKATSQPILFDAVIALEPNVRIGKIRPALLPIYLGKVKDPSLQKKLRSFMSEIDRDAPVSEQLIELRKLIHSQVTYSLEIENPDNLPPLENFLFGEKKGYCEFYASATAALCRELGIPSRVTFGWAGGKHYNDSNLYAFLAKNAHAWTEVYLEGFGWVIFDTTSPDDHPIFQNNNSDDTPPSDDEMKDSFTEDELTDYDYDEDGENGYLDKFFTWGNLAIGLLAGVLISTLLLILRKMRTPKAAIEYGEHYIPEHKYMNLFRKYCAKVNLPLDKGVTLKDQLDTLSENQLEPPFSHDLLEYHYDTVYRQRDRSKQTEKSLVQQIKKAISEIKD
mgnify:CR=1 FL=1